MNSRNFQISAAARLDLLEIWIYLAENASIQLADDILSDVENSIREISKNPGIGHLRDDLTEQDVRFYRVHSYFVIYEPNARQVARVLHVGRDFKSLLVL